MDPQASTYSGANRGGRGVTVYRVAERFTDEPGHRFRDDGDFSGEEFREDVLVDLLREALAKNQRVIINFDGVQGLPTSFLDEAFRGIIAKHPELPAERVRQLLTIEAPNSPRLWSYVRFAQDTLAKAKAPRH